MGGRGEEEKCLRAHTHATNGNERECLCMCVCVGVGVTVCVFSGGRCVVVECLCVSVFVALNSILDAINTNYIQLNN